MRKKLSVLLCFVLYAGMFASCASKEANVNAERIAEAIKESNLDDDITVVACSDIFAANDERDEQYPFIIFKPEEYVSEYCYIEVEDDGESEVYVLSVGDKNTGAAHTYDNMVMLSTYQYAALYDLDEDLAESVIKACYDEFTVTQSENIKVEKINKILSK